MMGTFMGETSLTSFQASLDQIFNAGGDSSTGTLLWRASAWIVWNNCLRANCLFLNAQVITSKLTPITTSPPSFARVFKKM